MPQAGVPQGQRTMMPGSPAPAAAPNPYQTQYQIPPQYPPVSPQDGTMMPQGAPQFAAAAPPSAPARKPVALLVLLALLILGAFGAGATVLVQGALGKRGGVGVLGSKQAALPAGPGAALNSSPQSPQGPGVMNAIGSPPPVGAPVIAHKGQNPDIPAGGVVNMNSREPVGGPRVTNYKQPDAPPGPSPLGSRSPATPGGPSPAAGPPPPPVPTPPDNRDLDRYLTWLRQVEFARTDLHSRGQAEIPPFLSDAYRTLMEGDDPGMLQRRIAGILRAAQHDTGVFYRAYSSYPWAQVPKDCRTLHRYYQSACQIETSYLITMLRSIGGLISVNNDPRAASRLQADLTGASAQERKIKDFLRAADNELEAVYKQRGLDDPGNWRIDPSSNSGVLSGLGGLLGM